MKWLLLGTGLLFLGCLPVLAQTGCRYSYRPAASYTPVVRQVPYRTTAGSYHQQVINVAEVIVPLFDYEVKDVFIFTGPPPSIPPGMVVGVDASNKEVRAMPAPPRSLPAAPAGMDRAALRSLLRLDERDLGFRPAISGYEPDAVIALPETARGVSGGEAGKLIAQLTPALVTACARCHQSGEKRVKGGFTLLSPTGGVVGGVKWQSVLDYCSSEGKARPSCPPSGDPLARADLERIRRLIALSR